MTGINFRKRGVKADGKDLDLYGKRPAPYRRCPHMSDATDYLMAHAIRTIMDARHYRRDRRNFQLRHIGSVYHLLSKQGLAAHLARKPRELTHFENHRGTTMLSGRHPCNFHNLSFPLDGHDGIANGLAKKGAGQWRGVR